jgi:CubicO group peptidase (beta-lactamase class C family)
MKRLLLFLALIILFACKKEQPTIPGNPSNPNPSAEYYFPPTSSNNWSKENLQALNWNFSDTTELFDLLSQNGTRAFIILYKGKIAVEKYWGNNILDNAPFDENSQWYWASAGKTISAFLVGLAQEDGLLNINDKTSDYLGQNWTGLPIQKEDLITIKHQLSMTTGLDYDVNDQDCTAPNCLRYKTDAGNQWYYHNAPYTLIKSVVENATNKTFNDFTDQKLESTIGMKGKWMSIGSTNVYLSSARDAARFGSLLLNRGKWSANSIMSDLNYFDEMTNSSQTLNPSYGYLFWLNGKSSIILPGFPNSFNQPLSDHAPADLFAGIGKNGQYLNIIPSREMVVIRMGDSPDVSPVPTVFHNQMWEKINKVIN